MAGECGAQLGIELEECLAGGGSDGNTTSLFAPTLDGLGAVGDGAHAAHEFIAIEPTLRRIALLALLLAAPPLDWHEGPNVAAGREKERRELPAASGSP
jgi:glutamate carboxypeptidase